MSTQSTDIAYRVTFTAQLASHNKTRHNLFLFEFRHGCDLHDGRYQGDLGNFVLYRLRLRVEGSRGNCILERQCARANNAGSHSRSADDVPRLSEVPDLPLSALRPAPARPALIPGAIRCLPVGWHSQRDDEPARVPPAGRRVEQEQGDGGAGHGRIGRLPVDRKSVV